MSNASAKSFIERGVSLTKTRKDAGDDLADLYKEAASSGLDKAALKECVALACDPEKATKKRERNSVVDLYLNDAGLTHLQTRA